MASVEDGIREVRRELADLETADHPAHVEQKRQDYVEALHRERRAAEQQLRLGRGLGDEGQVILGGGPLFESQLTGTQLAEEAQQTIDAINREIARVSA